MKPPPPTKGRKRPGQEALSVQELSDEELAAIAATELPAQYAYLDEELESDKP